MLIFGLKTKLKIFENIETCLLDFSCEKLDTAQPHLDSASSRPPPGKLSSKPLVKVCYLQYVFLSSLLQYFPLLMRGIDHQSSIFLDTFTFHFFKLHEIACHVLNNALQCVFQHEAGMSHCHVFRFPVEKWIIKPHSTLLCCQFLIVQILL